jgi:hypothetical protein
MMSEIYCNTLLHTILNCVTRSNYDDLVTPRFEQRPPHTLLRIHGIYISYGIYKAHYEWMAGLELLRRVWCGG